MTVNEITNSPLKEALQRKMKLEKKLYVENSSKFKALVEMAREERLLWRRLKEVIFQTLKSNGILVAPQYQYESRYFDQILDHFIFSELQTFRQRYLISTEHWAGPDLMGPIFLYCRDKGDIEWFAANTGLVWELAPRFGAMHRYYGEPMPYGNQEEMYKNASTLSLLTTEQALATFAILITELKRNLSAQDCPVVLFGGSYGGMLAAWMRLKYPYITIGSLASSAPVIQFEDVVPPETFYDIVSNDFRRESVSCFNTIKTRWDVI